MKFDPPDMALRALLLLAFMALAIVLLVEYLSNFLR
jgi:hypothetical protein